jgi:DNA-binding MarR family transcriptional regulator
MSNQNRTELVESLSVEVRKFIANVILFNQKVADGLGLNTTDIQCLHLLQLHGLLTPGQLAKQAYLSTGGVTVVLDRLEKLGYIKREPNPNDRRSLIVRPVVSKLRKMARLYQSKGERLGAVLAGYDAESLELLLDFFRQTNVED